MSEYFKNNLAIINHLFLLHTIKQFKNIKDLKSLGMIDEIEYDAEISVNNPIWIYC